jgi:hypothetical protein
MDTLGGCGTVRAENQEGLSPRFPIGHYTPALDCGNRGLTIEARCQRADYVQMAPGDADLSGDDGQAGLALGEVEEPLRHAQAWRPVFT